MTEPAVSDFDVWHEPNRPLSTWWCNRCKQGCDDILSPCDCCDLDQDGA